MGVYGWKRWHKGAFFFFGLVHCRKLCRLFTFCRVRQKILVIIGWNITSLYVTLLGKPMSFLSLNLTLKWRGLLHVNYWIRFFLMYFSIKQTCLSDGEFTKIYCFLTHFFVFCHNLPMFYTFFFCLKLVFKKWIFHHKYNLNIFQFNLELLCLILSLIINIISDFYY